jgi:hypothetical protein
MISAGACAVLDAPLSTDYHEAIMADAPRPSRDLNLIQEAVRTELAAIMSRAGGTGEMMPVGQCREELLSLRSEFSSQIEGMRAENREEFRGINDTLTTIGKTLASQNLEAVALKAKVEYEASLIKQRLDMKDENEKAIAQLKRGRDSTPIMPHQPSAPAPVPTQVNPATNPPASSDPDSKPIIPTSVTNAILLAIAAGIGGTIWHFVESSIWPREKHEAKTEQSATLPASTPSTK